MGSGLGGAPNVRALYSTLIRRPFVADRLVFSRIGHATLDIIRSAKALTCINSSTMSQYPFRAGRSGKTTYNFKNFSTTTKTTMIHK
jgi:hypothetical protein